MIKTYIVLDGSPYAVVSGSYLRQWIRSFTSYLAANIVRLNFIDKGPGVQTYSMQLQLAPWPVGTLPYADGVTVDPITQMQQLDASYGKIASVLSFTDPFGVVSSYGVYFTDYKISIPPYGTAQEAHIIATIQLTAATQLVN